MEEVRPDYYRVAGMETMSVIRAVLTEEEFRGVLKALWAMGFEVVYDDDYNAVDIVEA